MTKSTVKVQTLTVLLLAAATFGSARADPSIVIVPEPSVNPDSVDPAGPRPAVVVPARPAATLPAVASAAAPDPPPMSVLIVYQARRFVASQLAEAVARSLDANGIDSVEFVRLRTRPKSARIGFVYDADREAADMVERASGAAFGLPLPVRLAPGDAQTTRPGTIEIDLDG